MWGTLGCVSIKVKIVVRMFCFAVCVVVFDDVDDDDDERAWFLLRDFDFKEEDKGLVSCF